MALPAHLPVGVDPSEWVHHLDGLVLTGGADVDPARYGQQNTASDVEPERDTIEFALLDAAIGDSIPVLGICRGFQIVNVANGGSLHQDVPSHARYDLDPATEVHELTLVPGSRVHGHVRRFPSGELAAPSDGRPSRQPGSRSPRPPRTAPPRRSSPTTDTCWRSSGTRR